MRQSPLLVAVLSFVIGAALCLVAASFAVTAIEDSSEIGVRRALDQASYDWAEVEADGLQVILTGTSPTEAKRFDAISRVGTVVDSARVINQMDVRPTAALAAPQFSAEILRNDSGISIIGLIPAQTDREALIKRLNAIADDTPVTDLLETASYPVPRGWNDALGFAATALSRLPRSKLSVEAGLVRITAISDSAEARDALEKELTRAAPPGLRISMDIAAPRPVITPFTLRFLIDEEGARFDACSAENEKSRDRILNAAFRAGLSGNDRCTIGMGVPSPQWARAGELAIGALAELGSGAVTIADADITLVAAQGTNPAAFDRIVGELETELPDVFALHAVLPDPPGSKPSGPPEFVATLSPEGLVQLRGRLSDETLRQAVDSYARARFGSDSVYTAARLVSDLPQDWPIRVLSGLEALALLSNGAVIVTPDNVELRGVSTREDANATISGLLSDKLGEAETYDIDVTYRPPPPPVDVPPDPDVCEAELVEIQSVNKIQFEPGSATIAAESLDTMNDIADVLKACGEIRLEIQGHTDSQGRESMNQQLSQARAQSVLNELRARRVLTSTYVAVGYGETQPIASNDSESGREANRRIDFRLIRPEPIKEKQTTLEAVAEQTAAQNESADDSADDTEASSDDEQGSENEQN
ncbi:OmpA family protein [Sedimentitalea todarodis]|uniref:OmpA family protein n=1 Tax=Sedimentitalea todarodis TaxID=1631240 RepID=A0ABU3V7X2_9RHOB|nr:OmpA family protein [Sedimentitalea todarodis]MDU9002258.1 OmpA family protein [Sedimentitalea todarodis]